MKVLWFEVTIPKNYSQSDFHGAGWQDALESIIKKNKSIELAIAFESQNKTDEKSVFDGVTYFPLIIKIPFWNKFKNKFSTKVNRGLVIEKSLIIIEEFKPDIIHVFGSEWCFGHIASFTNIPVVIHMQGSIPPYNNAFYPPGYSYLDEFFFMFFSICILIYHKK